MRGYKIKQIDAFTDRPFGGNPAGVVLSADGLTDKEMLSIANEINASETAFILPSDTADFRIRWFSPKKEVLFCGHATVASLHALAEEGKFGMDKDGSYSFKVEAMIGMLSVEVNKRAHLIEIVLYSPKAKLVRENIDKASFLDALRIKEEALDTSLPIMRETNLDYLYVPINCLESLKNIDYSYNKLERFCEKYNFSGVCLFTKETFDSDSSVHSRFFTPPYGTREDPVTGSAQGPLGVYLLINGVVEFSGNEVGIKSEQGDIMGRPGRLTIKLSKDEYGGFNSKLVSTAVTVIDGEIYLPD
ncbi:MAG: PhzF family phenazine biosynthesis protein [Candidatus Methanofastidiosa archaeon]|jgi:PhzF family phenazine biosynthesis protein|nr:PhzF family phenazine biosynthesis protein [Candidatus Methanofastidiosa archaeon]